jgi:hypothetical protein
MENQGGMILAGETPDSSTRALWQAYQQSFSSKSGGTGQRKSCIWPYEVSLSIHRRDFLTCRKILRLGPTAYFLSEGSRATDFYHP